MTRLGFILLLLFSAFNWCSRAEQPVNFSRQIRPILSENCFTCHGPDDGQRKAKLRLDTPEGAFAIKDGKTVIKAGDSANSEVYKHISSQDPDEIMPPVKSGKKLTEEQVALIRKWIDEGAKWETHWAFQPPVRPSLPEVKKTDWPRNEIDRFVLAKLEEQNLCPSPEADKATLARRATLDLTGLPPTVEELDAFLADNSSGAYEKMVDRLLDSTRYGEQMARYWLDHARYADSHGYHIDAPRMVWKYREWVIDSFNRNKPFDQFTIEQIAGDMLPEASIDQKIASGFNRCNMSTGEGGAIEEEYRVKYAADRVETVGTVWLGLTVGCAQCHSHKYDPIAQKEFYQLAAFFNNIAENALDGNAPAPEPAIKVPSKDQAAEQSRFNKTIAALKDKLDGPNADLDKAQADWEAKWKSKLETTFSVIDPAEFKSSGGATFKKLDDTSILVEGTNPDRDDYEITFKTPPGQVGAIRLEALLDESLPAKSAARSDNGNFVLSEFEADAAPIAEPSRRERIRFMTALADYSQEKFPVTDAIDGKIDTGWGAEGHVKKENRLATFIPEKPFGFSAGTEIRVRLRFQSIFAKHAIGRFRLSVAGASEGLKLLTPTQFSSWQMAGPFTAETGGAAFETTFEPEKKIDLTATFNDGKIKWMAKPEFANGKVNTLSGDNSATYLYRTIRSPFARKTTLSFGSDDGIKVWLNGKVVLDKNLQRGIKPDEDKIDVELNEGENQLLLKVVNYSGGYSFYFNTSDEKGDTLSPSIAQILAFSKNEFSAKEKETLRRFYRQNFSSGWKDLSAELAQKENDLKSLEAQIPMTMVSRELDKPRDTYLLLRGQYDAHGEKVSPNVPAVLPPLVGVEKTNRLALAKWLVARDNPLTARVTVNRFWQRYFGTGIVKTAEDFGSQGEAPSHPELLDWLAAEFMDSGWNMKRIHRLILTSSTYKQSSRITPELLHKDPQNRLLARGPRFRMDAEMIRDSALALGGLLVEKVGGPSVKPYQPPGLWTEVSYGFKEDYTADKGQGLYRRSMYTYWKRQSPPPGMITFDAPSREVCTVRRQRTNTPLQALELMNDPQYLEASRGLARRMMTESGSTPEKRREFAYRLATARKPSQTELQILKEAFQKQLADFQANPEAATGFLGVGDSKPDAIFSPGEFAAWTSVASMILNLDATVTKS
jgi:hypothetical protein